MFDVWTLTATYKAYLCCLRRPIVGISVYTSRYLGSLKKLMEIYLLANSGALKHLRQLVVTILIQECLSSCFTSNYYKSFLNRIASNNLTVTNILNPLWSGISFFHMLSVSNPTYPLSQLSQAGFLNCDFHLPEHLCRFFRTPGILPTPDFAKTWNLISTLLPCPFLLLAKPPSPISLQSQNVHHPKFQKVHICLLRYIEAPNELTHYEVGLGCGKRNIFFRIIFTHRPQIHRALRYA